MQQWLNEIGNSKTGAGGDAGSFVITRRQNYAPNLKSGVLDLHAHIVRDANHLVDHILLKSRDWVCIAYKVTYFIMMKASCTDNPASK